MPGLLQRILAAHAVRHGSALASSWQFSLAKSRKVILAPVPSGLGGCPPPRRHGMRSKGPTAPGRDPRGRAAVRSAGRAAGDCNGVNDG